MLTRQIYYLLKPYTPHALRLILRRRRARRQLQENTATWPIDPAAGTKPAGWPGWPDGKRFAVVLTHDVEGPAGLDRCRELAELEMSLGFRSSFNFIPEGGYRVPDSLRKWLTESGFEVGVHDLQHDGYLYHSEKTFREGSVRINRYLREWSAVGFRGGFMLRNLEWLHRLELQYDASTFDTDPFEWQSDGTGTIFPFFVPAPSGNGNGNSAGIGTADTPRGYVELPYTLPQDSTLYLVLQEPDDSIWRTKLDWIAQQGGMALLNVHPDYLHIRRQRSSSHDVKSHYSHFLQYISTRYAGAYWHPLPRDVARFYSAWKFPTHRPAAKQ